MVSYSKVQQSKKTWIARSLNMGPIGCTKTSVTIDIHCVKSSEDLIYTTTET